MYNDRSVPPAAGKPQPSVSYQQRAQPQQKTQTPLPRPTAAAKPQRPPPAQTASPPQQPQGSQAPPPRPPEAHFLNRLLTSLHLGDLDAGDLLLLGLLFFLWHQKADEELLIALGLLLIL